MRVSRLTIRLACPALALALVAAPATAAGGGSDKPRRFAQTYGPYELKPEGLMQMPTEEFFAIDEPIWVLNYRTAIVDPSGKKLRDDLHCHTSFRTMFDEDWMKWSMASRKLDTIPFKGLYSDGHTTHYEFPEGFGVYFDKGESMRLVPMFNNRNPVGLDAAMRVSFDYVPAEEGEKLRPLFTAIQSVVYPHLYMVPPGTDRKEIEFDFEYAGTLHLIAVHVHPYGKTVELINDTKGETVWTSVGNRRGDGTLIDMPVYNSVKGYAFTPDESYRLRVTYENPTEREQDAMGGIFMYFSTEDDEMPRPGPIDPTEDPGDSPPAHDHGHDHGGH